MARKKQPPPAPMRVEEPQSAQVTGVETSNQTISASKPEINTDTLSVEGHAPSSQSSDSQPAEEINDEAEAVNNGVLSTPTTPEKPNEKVILDSSSVIVVENSQEITHFDKKHLEASAPIDPLPPYQTGQSGSNGKASSLESNVRGSGGVSESKIPSFYCHQCEEDLGPLTSKEVKRHNVLCSEAHGLPAPLRRSDPERSESPLSDPPGGSEPSDDDDLEDDADGMPLPYIRHQFTSYPNSTRNTPAFDTSDMDVANRTMKFPALTDVGEFAESLEHPEDLDETILYRRIVNAQSALKLWQEEWQVNDVTTRLLERAAQPDNTFTSDKRVTGKTTKNPRAEARPDIVAAESKEEGPVEKIWKLHQTQQDIIEANAYGYEHDTHHGRVGAQDIIAQRVGAGGDGRRFLRRPQQPTRKVIDGELSTDSESEEVARPTRAAARGNSRAVSRMTSEVPDDTHKGSYFPSGKRRGRPPAHERIGKLQQQEGRFGGVGGSPDRSNARGRLPNAVLQSTEFDDGDGQNMSSDGEQAGDGPRKRAETSEFEGKKPIAVLKQKKKKKKIFSDKRLYIKQIQMKRPEDRSEEDQKAYKNFREKKGAWATRLGKDVDAVLARFDRDALETSDDETEDEQPDINNGVSAVTGTVKQPLKAVKAVAAPALKKAKKVKVEGGKPSAASLNMKERWRKKREAIARGENPPAIGRYKASEKEKAKTGSKEKSVETQQPQPVAAPATSQPIPPGAGKQHTFKLRNFGNAADAGQASQGQGPFGQPAGYAPPNGTSIKRKQEDEDPMGYNQGTGHVRGGKKIKLNGPSQPSIPPADFYSNDDGQGKRGPRVKPPTFPQLQQGNNDMYSAPSAYQTPYAPSPGHFTGGYGPGPIQENPLLHPAAVNPFYNGPPAQQQYGTVVPAPKPIGRKISSTESEIEVDTQNEDVAPAPPAKKSRKGVGGRPSKKALEAKKELANEAPEIKQEKGNKSRKPRRTAQNNTLSSLTIDDSDEAADVIHSLQDAAAGNDESAPGGARRSKRDRRPTPAAIEAGMENLTRPNTASSNASSTFTGAFGTGGSATMAPPAGPVRRGKLAAAAEPVEQEAEKVERPTKRNRKTPARYQLDGADERSGDDADQSALNTFTASAAKYRKRKSTTAFGGDGADDSEADTPPSLKRRRGARQSIPSPIVPALSRKVSVYEEYQALSSPTHNPLGKRGKRSAALKARRSFNVSESSDGEVSTIGEKAEQQEVDQQLHMTDYERYQALTSPAGGDIGKRKRKPVVDMAQIMAMERAGETDED